MEKLIIKRPLNEDELELCKKVHELLTNIKEENVPISETNQEQKIHSE